MNGMSLSMSRRLKRDAALGRRKSGLRHMQEDRTAHTAPPRTDVPVEHEPEIVEHIVSDEVFVAGRERQPHRPVVSRVAGRVAPSVPAADPPQRQARTVWRQHAAASKS
jgi:hypothetical protein